SNERSPTRTHWAGWVRSGKATAHGVRRTAPSRSRARTTTSASPTACRARQMTLLSVGEAGIELSLSCRPRRSFESTCPGQVSRVWPSRGRAITQVAAADLTYPRSARGSLTVLGHCVMVASVETLWWRCHRRLIAELLHARGHEVVHLLRPGHSEP